MHQPTSFGAIAALLLATISGSQADDIYSKNSPVLQVNARDYQDLITKSNQTTILEFYAPWCGHCKKLKPAYEKAAKNLEGLAKVAAVNCDDELNKQFCGKFGVQGFPTLKIVRPLMEAGKKPGVEDYSGPRTASGIVDAVVERINNHVKRVTDKGLDEFLSKTEGPKAILFTDKGTVSALLKAVAIDFLGVVEVAQIRNKEKDAVEKFGIEKFPTLVLISGPGQEPITYDGPVKKADMVKFISQVGGPNPDPAPEETKKKADEKKAKADEKKPKAAEPEDAASADSPQFTETVQTPVKTEAALPIPTIHDAEKLTKECLNEKSTTCVLAFVPAETEGNKNAEDALTALSDLKHKYAQSKRKLFPFFAVPGSNTGSEAVVKALGLGDKPVQIIAINARRNWWRQFSGDDFSHQSIENWIDAIRMGEGAKNKLPAGLVAEVVDGTTPGAEGAASTATVSESSETKGSDPVAEPETGKPAETPAGDAHDEL